MKTRHSSRRFYLMMLAGRTVVFAFLVGYGLFYPEQFAADMTATHLRISPLILAWAFLMASMVIRLFPCRLESLGCQKEFAHRCRPTGRAPKQEEVRQADMGAFWVLLSWTGVNALFFLAHWAGWIGNRFLVCLTGFYSVCDIICILFFCPFQSWMMHNRCCTVCRIYNWDYLMMCTPLILMKGLLAQSACILAIILFLRWELTYFFRRERFFERSNKALQCSQCQEQLCKYKRALLRQPQPK